MGIGIVFIRGEEFVLRPHGRSYANQIPNASSPLRLAGGGVAGIGHGGQVAEEILARGRREDGEDFGLQLDGDGTGGVVFLLARRAEPDAVGSAVALVRGAEDQTGGFHALEHRGDRVGVAAHGFGELPLGHAPGLAFQERAHDGELVGSDAKPGDAAAEGLVEAVPGPAQEGGEAPAFGRVDGQRGGGAVLAGGHHKV